jgi:hypothetical protein
MLYAVDGVALGGWQLVDLSLMAVIAIELLSLIFLKVVIILLGALLYATGPVTIGLVATESGAALARAWASAVAMLIALPIVWATLFAVGALLVGDAGTAGPLIAGDSSIGSLLGGVILAVAGAASLWLCLRAAREAMGLLRMQLGGLLALSHRGSSGPARVTASRSSSVDSLRRFGTRVAQAAGGAAGELAAASTAGAAAVRGGRALGYLGRHGALGTAAAGGRAAAALATPRAGVLVGRSRAGAVAVRMAKAGTASWQATPNAHPTPTSSNGHGSRSHSAAGRSNRGSERDQGGRTTPTAAAALATTAGGGRAATPSSDARPAARGPAEASATRPAAGKARDTERRNGRPAPQPPTPPPTFTPSPRSGKRPGRGKR